MVRINVALASAMETMVDELVDILEALPPDDPQRVRITEKLQRIENELLWALRDG